MAWPLTAAMLLLASVFFLKGLRHPFYLVHAAIILPACALAQHFFAPTDAVFSKQALAAALLIHLLSVNFVTYWAYWHDKRAAILGNWRVPERTLRALQWMGGGPAAFVAQRRLRHKTRKRSFQSAFWLIAFAQLLGLGLLFYLAR
jgi:uncharacterized membrane protein YsdA (DUF1294 family)